MRVRLLVGAATAVAALSFTGAARAQVIQLRLDAKESSVQSSKRLSGDVMSLELKPGQDADLEEVRGGHGGHGGWGRGGGWGHGGWGGYRGGWGRGYGWGGYRGWGYGGWGRGWGWGGYRGWGYGGWYRPWGYYGYYRPWGWYGGWGYPYYSYYSYPVYSYPSYYYYSPYAVSYYYPVNGAVGAAGAANSGDQILIQPRTLPNTNGNFQYDGGPTNPVPLPGGAAPPAPVPSTSPTRRPAATAPLDGKLVSVPAAKPSSEKFAYPAYGEKRSTNFAETRKKDQLAEKR